MAEMLNTNYGGTVSEILYTVLGVGNEVVANDSAFLETNVTGKKSLPRLSATAKPLAAYKASPETSDATQTTSYAENTLEVERLMVYEEITAEDFADIWPEWQSVNGTTNLEISPALLNAIMELKANSLGLHVAELAWQGDTGGGAGLDLIDGWLKQFEADANVIDVTNQGLIDATTIVPIIEAVWNAIPEHLFSNQDMCIHMSTNNFRLLQTVNLGLKESTVGVLDTAVGRLFLEKRIKHYASMPDTHIVAAVGSTERRSNLVMGVYVPEEAVRIARTSNLSDVFGMRLDMRLGVSYRAGEEIVLYKGAVIPGGG